MHLVMIGGSDAGISAALRARELDPAADVTVVLEDAYPNFSICGIPYYLSGEVTHWRNLAHRSIGDLEAAGMPTVDPDLGALVHAELAGRGVEVLTGTTVQAVTRAGPGQAGRLHVQAATAEGTAITRRPASVTSIWPSAEGWAAGSRRRLGPRDMSTCATRTRSEDREFVHPYVMK